MHLHNTGSKQSARFLAGKSTEGIEQIIVKKPPAMLTGCGFTVILI